MGVDIKEVARRSKVSIATVSRTLNSSGYVRDETRQRVLDTARDLGFTKNRVASSLRKKRSRSIGLIVPDIANEFFADLAGAVEEVLQENDYSLLLCNTREDPTRQGSYIESLRAHQVSGIILVSTVLPDRSLPVGDEIPIILADRFDDSRLAGNVVSVESDNYAGGRLAAEALIRGGARRLVFLRDRRDIRHMALREQGFLDAVRENGIGEGAYRIYPTTVSPDEALVAIKEIRAAFSFDGLFCGTDTIALGAIRGLIDVGVRIPEDAQIIGFDGIAFGRFAEPPLSTIRQDSAAMGRICAERIMAMIGGKRVIDHIVLPVELTLRGTTRPVVGEIGR
jgi:LacI family transcriptional regulator